MFITSAANNHKHLCKYIIKHNLSDSNILLEGAASDGHMNICKYAIKHGATDFDQMLLEAAKYGHKKYAKWLYLMVLISLKKC